MSRETTERCSICNRPGRSAVGLSIVLRSEVGAFASDGTEFERVALLCAEHALDLGLQLHRLMPGEGANLAGQRP